MESSSPFSPSVSPLPSLSTLFMNDPIAFHLGPRLLIAAVYYNFLKSFDKALSPDSETVLNKLLKGCYYLQICEIIGLCGISFIHNREHYRKSSLIFLHRDWCIKMYTTENYSLLVKNQQSIDAEISWHTLLVKYYNDLLGRQMKRLWNRHIVILLLR